MSLALLLLLDKRDAFPLAYAAVKVGVRGVLPKLSEQARRCGHRLGSSRPSRCSWTSRGRGLFDGRSHGLGGDLRAARGHAAQG